MTSLVYVQYMYLHASTIVPTEIWCQALVVERSQVPNTCRGEHKIGVVYNTHRFWTEKLCPTHAIEC